MKITEVSAINTAKWHKLEEEGKVPYRELNVEEKERYNREKEEYIREGHFFNKDGIKSTFLTRTGKILPFESGTVLPKRAKTAFTYYVAIWHKKSKAANSSVSS